MTPSTIPRSTPPQVPSLTIRTPDDWHLHLRDGAMLDAVVTASAQHFARAIIMPNLVPPVVTAADALAYRQRIDDVLTRSGQTFEPLMTLYLTDDTPADTVTQAARDGLITAVKLYPAGATTNSASGVTAIERVMPVLERMAAEGVVLCVHGEVTDADVDIFDREARFVDDVLAPLSRRLPELRIVMEHVTTAEGIDFVRASGRNVAATVTPHHLMINRNHLLVGGIRPHLYCLPVVKRERHRRALVDAVTAGHERVFLGTDSAPHRRGDKQSDCGCAGVFNAPTTLSCLASVFEDADALARLEAFTSLNGPAFYRLPANEGRLRLDWQAEPVDYPRQLPVGDDEVVVFLPDRPLHWRITRLPA